MTPQQADKKIKELIDDLQSGLTPEEYVIALEVLANAAILAMEVVDAPPINQDGE
jgi:hypothetical protein